MIRRGSSVKYQGKSYKVEDIERSSKGTDLILTPDGGVNRITISESMVVEENMGTMGDPLNRLNG